LISQYIHFCIKSKASAFTNLPNPARWSLERGCGHVGNEGVRITKKATVLPLIEDPDMISRRDFLRGSTALAVTPLVESILNHHEHFEEPLLVKPNVTKRVFYMHEDHSHDGFRIVTDALPFPRRLVKFNAIENEFGEGAFRSITQRDHWRLIDEGRFSRDETFQPAPGDGFFFAWSANYSPSSEAYNLLEDVGLGPDQDFGSVCGLEFFDTDELDAKPAVLCVSTKAISLLQAELVRRKAPIEVRFEERGFENFDRHSYLRNGGNSRGI
jgi:hypothetical protein